MKDKGNTKNIVIFDHHIVRNSQICSLNNLTSKEIYLILVNTNTAKSTAQDYFKNLFESSQNWKKCFLIRNITMGMLYYNVLHNTLYANKILFKFEKVTPQCSLCILHDETIMHLFYDCLIIKRLWNQLKSILSNDLIIPISTPQSAIFGFWDLDTNDLIKQLNLTNF